MVISGVPVRREINGRTVTHQRPGDGYINATAMCQSAGRRAYDYLRLRSTTEVLDTISLETGIPRF